MNKPLLFLICFLITISAAMALSVVETASTTTVAPGGKFFITYTPTDVTGKVIWIVRRTIPQGFVITQPSSMMLEGSNYGLFGFNAEAIKFEVTASSTPGTYKFTQGEYVSSQEITAGQTEDSDAKYPDLTIIVSGAVTNTTCTPSWQTGAWSNVTGACGIRTVTDANACSTLTGRPELSKSCGVGEKKNICENLPNLTGDCTIDGIILVFIALMVLAIFSKMMRK